MASQKSTKYINYLLYALVIIVPLIYFPTSIFPFNIIKITVFQSLVEIIFAMWLGLALFYKKYRPRPTPLLVSLLAFAAILSIASVFGIDLKASLWSDEQRALGLVTIIHLVALFAVINSLREEINWKKLWMFSFLTAAAVSLIGISQKFITVPMNASPWLRILYPSPIIPERIGSTVSNSSFLAGYLLFNLFLGLWLIKIRFKSDARPWLWGLGITLILAGIFLAQTLGAFFGLAVGILYLLAYFIAKGAKNVRYAAAAILLLSIVFSAVFFYTKGDSFWQRIPGLSRIAQASLRSPSIHDRLLVWQISLAAFKDKPLLGWGLENFRTAYDAHYNPMILSESINGTAWDKPHNVILEYLVTSGILGLFAYIAIWYSLFFSIFKLSKKGSEDFTPLIFSSMFVAYFAQNLFVFDTIGTYLMFFFTIAFIDSRYQAVVPSIREAHLFPDRAVPLKYLKTIIVILIFLTLVPIYYNYAIFNGAWSEYWGVNYLLNRLPESSLLYFSQAMSIPTPYSDDIIKNFANTTRDAFHQGLQYANTEKLQENLINPLRGVIVRHPKNFFNYLVLAEFEEEFYKYNPGYLDDAESLLKQALQLSPERQQVYYPLAKAELLRGNKQAAYGIFQQLINLNPDAGEPHFYFGLLAYNLGDIKKGDEEITIASRLGREPQTPEEFVALANYVGDYDHDYKRAIGLYNRALTNLSNMGSPQTRPNILLKLAVAYYFDKDYDNARQTFLELEQMIDLKSLPIYPQLKPVLEQLKINSQ